LEITRAERRGTRLGPDPCIRIVGEYLAVLGQGLRIPPFAVRAIPLALAISGTAARRCTHDQYGWHPPAQLH
jgi:hypothetical protein